jgi:predicted outer membrane protein
VVGPSVCQRTFVAAIFFCAASSWSIAQNTADSTRPSISASEFVAKAGAGGLAEVEMGEVGVQKASNGQVKASAKRVVTDHTKANEQLVSVTKGKAWKYRLPAARCMRR